MGNGKDIRGQGHILSKQGRQQIRLEIIFHPTSCKETGSKSGTKAAREQMKTEKTLQQFGRLAIQSKWLR